MLSAKVKDIWLEGVPGPEPPGGFLDSSFDFSMLIYINIKILHKSLE
jgi:hypothetical protein